MMKFSETPRRSMLALVAVATLGSVVVTDASAGGFHGGAIGGGARSFGGVSRGIGGGAQPGGFRQASLPTAIHAPVGGPLPAHSGPLSQVGTKPKPTGPVTIVPTPAPAGPTNPVGTKPKPTGPVTIVPKPEPAGPTNPVGTKPKPTGPVTIIEPKPAPVPPGSPPPPPQAGNPNPPPHAGYPANPYPPAYPPAPGGDGGAIISVGVVGAVVGDAVAAAASDTVAVPPVAYTPVTGPACDRLLRNGCYLALRKYSTPSGGAELRCTLICE